jgi:hypothetical protein
MTDFHTQLHEVGPVDQAEQGLWRGERDCDQLLFALPNNNIAGQQQSDIGVCTKRLVGDPRIADTENSITTLVNGKLLFKDRLQVDIGDDSKSLLLQFSHEHVQGVIEIRSELY